MDSSDLATMLRNMVGEIERSSQPQDPLPVIEVPPPVVVKGLVSIQATFDHTNYIGKTQEELIETVLSVLAGARGAWLPRVEIGDVKLWRERVGPDERGTGQTADHPNISVRPGGSRTHPSGYLIDVGTERTAGTAYEPRGHGGPGASGSLPGNAEFDPGSGDGPDFTIGGGPIAGDRGSGRTTDQEVAE